MTEQTNTIETAVTSDEIANAAKDAEIATLKAQNEALKKPGIPSAEDPAKKEVPRNPDGTVKRTDEIMQETLAEAVLKEPGDLSDDDRVAIEREIRRYVKRGGTMKGSDGRVIMSLRDGSPRMISGGFKKGIPEADKARCKHLLKLLGRDTETPSWDTTIRVPGFKVD